MTANLASKRELEFAESLFVLLYAVCHFSPCAASDAISPALAMTKHKCLWMTKLRYFYYCGVVMYGARGSKRKISMQMLSWQEWLKQPNQSH